MHAKNVAVRKCVNMLTSEAHVKSVAEETSASTEKIVVTALIVAGHYCANMGDVNMCVSNAEAAHFANIIKFAADVFLAVAVRSAKRATSVAKQRMDIALDVIPISLKVSANTQKLAANS